MGLLQLREQFAQRIAENGRIVSADGLLITGGCQYALLLALMATTEPRDVVETPDFYGAFKLLEALGCKSDHGVAELCHTYGGSHARQEQTTHPRITTTQRHCSD